MVIETMNHCLFFSLVWLRSFLAMADCFCYFGWESLFEYERKNDIDYTSSIFVLFIILVDLFLSLLLFLGLLIVRRKKPAISSEISDRKIIELSCVFMYLFTQLYIFNRQVCKRLLGFSVHHFYGEPSNE